MNSPENKEKRAYFVNTIQRLESERRKLVYVDEYNYNLHCQRINREIKEGNSLQSYC